MNIIEKTKEIINGYPGISDFSNGIDIDYTDTDIGSFGIFSEGDSLIQKTILGGQRRRHDFVLFATNQSYTNYDRLNNSTFLLELGYWLDSQKGQTFDAVVGKTIVQGAITDVVKTGTITSMYCANAMVFEPVSQDINDGITYHVQVYVEYTVEP